MKLKKTLIAIVTGCVSFSVYAVDQVVKEEITPPGPEGAIMVNQIPPVYSPPAPQKAPVAQAETQQPVMPSISTTQTPAQPVAAPQQPATQPATQGQPSETTQGTLPQNALPNPPQAPNMQTPPQQSSGMPMPQQQNAVPAQQPLSTP